MGEGREKRRVETLARGLALMNAFGEERGELTLTELAVAAGLPKPTALRMLRTLEEFGFVTRAEGVYRVGPRCLALGRLYRFDAHLQERALPEMEALMRRTGEVVQLGVLRDSKVLYLERVQPERSVTLVMSRPGSELPAYCTGQGKVLLAHRGREEVERFLERVRLEARSGTTITTREGLLEELEGASRLGYAFDDGEYDPEIRCVAAPIFDAEGRAVAALSIAAPKYRMPSGVRNGIRGLVVEAAGRISDAYAGSSEEEAEGQG